MRPPKACRQCRISKRKCVDDTDTSQIACIPCQHRKLQCSKRPTIKVAHSLLPRVEVPEPEPTLTAEIVHNFVQLYFTFIHDRPQSIFHTQSLWDDIHKSCISESLLVAICATGCRFCTDPQNRRLSQKLRAKSASIFSQQLETISISNIQTCILLANLYAGEQKNGLEALYFGIATRMAHILRLREQHPEDSPVVREIKCRVWWTLWIADKWCHPGLGLSREMVNPDHTVDLPMDETTFQGLGIDDSFWGPRRDGLWKYMITLADNLGPIQDLNQSLVRDSSSRREIDQRVAHIVNRLEIWYNSLPKHMLMDDQNLESYRTNHHGGTLIALHLGYHHYCTLLYFQYLETEMTHYIERCRYHALSFSHALHTARQKGDCHVVYLTVAHMTIVSSAVLLHMLLFGDQVEISVARIQMIRNFEALVDICNYWPEAKGIIERLFTFQNACFHSVHGKTYKVDKWMVRFLLEHALPLGEKIGDTASTETSPSVIQEHEVSYERTSMLSEALAHLNPLRTKNHGPTRHAMDRMSLQVEDDAD